jgi:HPt (histidine-containing phosphotransfer) domain-containing protein
VEGCDEVISKPVSLERLRKALTPLVQGAVQPQAEVGPDAIRVPVDLRLRTLTARFLANCGRDLARLRAALAGGELAVTRAIGHSLRGSGSSYGFDEITRLGRAIEEDSLRGDAESVGGLVAQLEDYLSRVRPEFR